MQRPMFSTAGVSLRALLPVAEFRGADDIQVQACCMDSQACEPGDLFVAMKGDRSDGHDFIAEALLRGATAVLSERLIPGLAVPVCVVPHTDEAYGRICQALVGEPTKKVKTIGVTGTNGKTTTTYLIASLLEHAGYRPGVLGSLGYCDRREMHPATHTTPPAHVLATWLARMEANGCTHAVMEVSSHALAQSRVAGIQFDVACVTNVQQDHLDFHGSLANYREAKARIFEHLSPEGMAVLNGDDKASVSYLSRIHGPVLTIGMGSSCEVSATIVERRINEQTFLLAAGDETVPVRSHLIGLHNIYNCLIASAVGLAYGVDLTTIARGLEDVRVMPGRLERVECGQPFGVFVDYAHTPDALANSLGCLRSVTPGRLICVFGAGGDRERQKRPLMGRVVEQQADVVVVTSDNPRGEEPSQIIDQILSGFREQRKRNVIVDRAEAIRWALDEARAGDCVLIAGKGHETFQIIGNERLPFDDRDVVRQLLWGAKSPPEVARPAAA